MLTFSTAYGPPNDGHTIRLTAHSRARCEVYLDCLGATEEETTRPGTLDHGMVSSSRSNAKEQESTRRPYHLPDSAQQG